MQENSFLGAGWSFPFCIDEIGNVGMSYFEKGQYKEAIEEYGKASRIAPLRLDIHERLAEAYSIYGEHDLAAKTMRKVIFDEKGKERPNVTQAQKSLWKRWGADMLALH